MHLGHILIIEDEEHIVELIKFNLENNGYKVSFALDGQKGLELIENEQPDLVLLDLMLPKVDGIDICNRVKNNKNLKDIPIIMLTAKSGETDKIIGLEIGADDYITKPIKPKVLVSKVKSLLRRLKTEEKSDTTTKIGDIVINRDEYVVFKGDTKIALPRKEFELFSLLTSKPGKVFKREVILDNVWGNEVVVGGRTIDVHIRKLREKIGDDYFKTVKGVGYKFVLDEADK